MRDQTRAKRCVVLVLSISASCGKSEGNTVDAANGSDVPVGPAATWHVDDDAPAGGSGTSWNTPMRFLQDALAVAAPGDIIAVAAGTYRPDRTDASPDGSRDRAATFTLRSGVQLLGGYAGASATDPALRDPAMFITVLSGDLAGDDAGRVGADNAYHVVTGTGADDTAVLDGFTISGGNANGPLNYPSYDKSGAGMLNADAGARPTIRSCQFVGNRATQFGAAIANDHGASPAISDSVFIDNVAIQGGALYNGDRTLVTVTRSTFENNSANAGGAIVNLSGATVRITDSLFDRNHALPSGNGGAIYSVGAMPDVVNSIFRGNQSGHVGGAFSTRDTPGRARIVNCLFEGNSSGDGGGAVRVGKDSELLVVNSAFIGNSTALMGRAGALDVGTDTNVALRTSLVVNSIFRGNSGGGVPMQLALWGNYPAGLEVQSSNIEGGQPGIYVKPGFPLTWGTGNIDADPAFVNAPAGDYRLSPGSACIDVGSSSHVPTEVTVDLSGAPRVTGANVDLGPYEYKP